MGIDRIGKGGAAPPAPDVAGKGSADKIDSKAAVDKPFQVERPTNASAPASAGHVEGAQAASPLARLRAGEIDVERYLDLKVDEATQGIEGLPAADLADIKKMLRDQLATDPGLVDLVRAATGTMPSAPADE